MGWQLWRKGTKMKWHLEKEGTHSTDVVWCAQRCWLRRKVPGSRMDPEASMILLQGKQVAHLVEWLLMCSPFTKSLWFDAAGVSGCCCFRQLFISIAEKPCGLHWGQVEAWSWLFWHWYRGNLDQISSKTIDSLCQIMGTAVFLIFSFLHYL